jgi:hypothetical protein
MRQQSKIVGGVEGMNGVQLGWIDYSWEHRMSRRDKNAFLTQKKDPIKGSFKL